MPALGERDCLCGRVPALEGEAWRSPEGPPEPPAPLAGLDTQGGARESLVEPR